LVVTPAAPKRGRTCYRYRAINLSGRGGTFQGGHCHDAHRYTRRVGGDAGRGRPRFLLLHGTDDDIVEPVSQSGAFLTALTQAQIFVRRIIIPGAGHFWSADPFENEPNSYGATAAPRLLRFLGESL
jgi:acetyl esterase/lipase